MKFFVDNEYVKDVQNSIKPYFKSVNGGYRLRTVGVVINKEETFVFLPHNADKQLIEQLDVQLLIKLLQKFKSSGGTHYGTMPFIEESDMFTTIEWLISDFKRFGLLNRIEEDIKIQSNGIISWSTTIRHVQPTIIDNDPYITKFVRRRKRTAEDDLTKIHRTVIQRIAKLYGNLFSLHNFQYNRGEKFLNDREMLTILNKHLRVVNNVRTKELLKRLISYLNMATGEFDLRITTEEFHIIWEQMISSVWQHNNKLKQYISKAKWEMNFDSYSVSGINQQIPDTLIDENGSMLTILDAKYYDLTYSISNLGSVPLEWYSVVKQFFYEESFNFKSAGLCRGKNIFVFPYYKKNHDVSELMHIVGEVTIELPILGSRRIYVGLVPVFSLIQIYLRHEKKSLPDF